MSEFKGTPGPWATTKAKPRMVTSNGVLICTAVLRNMGTTAQNKRGKGQEEATANAQLIAAAFDLLTSLQEALTDGGIPGWEDRAQLAIAKALNQ